MASFGGVMKGFIEGFQAGYKVVPQKTAAEKSQEAFDKTQQDSLARTASSASDKRAVLRVIEVDTVTLPSV